MSARKIECPQFSGNAHGGKGHIVAVRTSYGREAVEQVRKNLAAGTESYYTVSPSTNKIALVEPYDCWCGVKTIRSKPDAVRDNNLDNMPVCR